MQAFNPYKTKETVNAMYWCGRQTVTTTLDFMETLQSIGMISAEEHTEYANRISKLNNLLVETHNALKRKMKESTQE